jgi:transposase
MMTIMLFDVALISGIAKIFNIGLCVVSKIIKNTAQDELGNSDLSNITIIAIAELGTHKINKCLTMVIDVLTGRPLFVGDGQGEAALEPFWKALGPRGGKRVQAVVIDMGEGYVSAVTKNLPNAKIVHDLLHVIKLVNDVLDELRIEAGEAASREGKPNLAGKRRVRLRGDEDVLADGVDSKRLAALPALSGPLSAARVKEDLLQIWSRRSKPGAARALAKWIETARSSGVPSLLRLADTLERHSEGILNCWDFKINSGAIKASNEKIKA